VINLITLGVDVITNFNNILFLIASVLSLESSIASEASFAPSAPAIAIRELELEFSSSGAGLINHAKIGVINLITLGVDVITNFNNIFIAFKVDLYLRTLTLVLGAQMIRLLTQEKLIKMELMALKESPERLFTADVRHTKIIKIGMINLITLGVDVITNFNNIFIAFKVVSQFLIAKTTGNTTSSNS
jgi:predicted transport protein